MAISHDGNLCRVMKVQHITPGNWRGMVQVKLRNLTTGNSFEHRFRSEDRVERASLEQHEVEFLYKEGNEYHFMNIETYEQFHLTDDVLGDNMYFLTPNIRVKIEFNEANPVGVEMPGTVDLKVISTDPGLKGATATNSGKPATLETGLVVQVPQFISEGEVIRIDTADGKYLERAK